MDRLDQVNVVKIEDIQAEIEELEKQEYVILKTIESYENRNKINFFKPHEKQQFAIDAVKNNRKKVIIFQGSNRSGKTTWLITTLVSLLLGEFPWSKEATRFKSPIRARLFGEDWLHHIGQVIIPKLKEWVPLDHLAHTKKNNQGIEYLWYFKNGSILEIMTYEQATEQVEGWSGHVVAADEPMPRDKYIACKRGLVDYDGIFLMSFTPLKEPWIYDELITKGDPAVAAYGVNITENPYLTKDAIAEFERSLTDEEKEARIKGQWLHLQGLVYKEFDPKTHLVQPFKVPAHWTGYCAIDTHPRTEQAVTFAAVDEGERVFITHEVFSHAAPEEVAEWIISHHINKYKLTGGVLIEPGSQGDKNRGDSTYDIIAQKLWKFKIGLELGSKDLDGGILQVKRFLKSPNNIPSLFIFDNLDRTYYEFTHYLWGDWRKSEVDRGAKQKPKDKDDHMLENIRRICLLPPRYLKTYYSKPVIQNKAGIL